MFANDSGHSGLADADGRFAHTRSTSELGIEIIHRLGECRGILTEPCRVRPRLDDVSTRHLTASFERSREAVFVERRTVTRRHVKDDLRGESLLIGTPRRARVISLPVEFLTPFSVVTTPESSVPLVESGDVLNTVEGTPRRPRSALCQFVTKGGSIEGVGSERVGEESSTIEHRARLFGLCTNEDVIVEMRFAVPIDPVRKAHDASPSTTLVAITAVSTVAYDERMLLEVGNRRTHGFAMGRDDARTVVGIDGNENRDGSRGGHDDVVTLDGGALRRAEHTAHVARISRIATTAQPPTGAAVTQAVKFERRIVREVTDVVGTPRHHSNHRTPRGPNGRDYNWAAILLASSCPALANLGVATTAPAPARSIS